MVNDKKNVPMVFKKQLPSWDTYFFFEKKKFPTFHYRTLAHLRYVSTYLKVSRSK